MVFAEKTRIGEPPNWGRGAALSFGLWLCPEAHKGCFCLDSVGGKWREQQHGIVNYKEENYPLFRVTSNLWTGGRVDSKEVQRLKRNYSVGKYLEYDKRINTVNNLM